MNPPNPQKRWKAPKHTPASKSKIIELREVYNLTFASIGQRYGVDAKTASNGYATAREKLAVAK
jgi:DNA-directed RNA polymerase specialized sigma24 family protein